MRTNPSARGRAPHLTIPSQHRPQHTVARTGARPGQWCAVVRDAGGNEIGQVEFTVAE